MADVNVLDLSEVTPGSGDSLILFDRTTGAATSTRFETLKGAVTGDIDATVAQHTSQIQTLTNNVSTNATNIANVAQKVSNSSDEFDSTKAYKYGDLVIHDNVLYRCTTACSAASWAVNKTCFVETTITSELTKLDEYSAVSVTKDSFPKLSSGMTFQKYGHVVDVTIGGFKDLTVANDNIMTGLIPVGFRPMSTRIYDLVGPGSQEIYRVRFETNGTLVIYPYTGTSQSANVIDSISYLS